MVMASSMSHSSSSDVDMGPHFLLSIPAAHWWLPKHNHEVRNQILDSDCLSLNPSSLSHQHAFQTMPGLRGCSKH